jgi:fructose/tagatose bisphosphate aldolase
MNMNVMPCNNVVNVDEINIVLMYIRAKSSPVFIGTVSGTPTLIAIYRQGILLKI